MAEHVAVIGSTSNVFGIFVKKPKKYSIEEPRSNWSWGYRLRQLRDLTS
jgi:hypothetical protein